MYRLHNSSEHSGVTNMYSLSASRSGTPTQVLGGGGTQTSALLHSQPYPHQPGILVGGANHPSNHPGHVSNTLSYPQHAHNHTASQFTLQLDELDQMQMMQHQQGGADGQLNGGMSHSHTLPHNLSHQSKINYVNVNLQIAFSLKLNCISNRHNLRYELHFYRIPSISRYNKSSS